MFASPGTSDGVGGRPRGLDPRSVCTGPKSWLRDLWAPIVSRTFPSPFLQEKTGGCSSTRFLAPLPTRRSGCFLVSFVL